MLSALAALCVLATLLAPCGISAEPVPGDYGALGDPGWAHLGNKTLTAGHLLDATPLSQALPYPEASEASAPTDLPPQRRALAGTTTFN